MAKSLGERIVDVLAEGGPRKPHILRAMATATGHGELFDRTIAELKRARRIVIRYRQGGPHYAINPKAG